MRSSSITPEYFCGWPIDKDEKAKGLILLDVAGWKATVNFSLKNLNKIGFDAGAQVVISSSHKGVMILSERGLEVQGLNASKGWSQRYPTSGATRNAGTERMCGD